MEYWLTIDHNSYATGTTILNYCDGVWYQQRGKQAYPETPGLGSPSCAYRKQDWNHTYRKYLR